MKKLAILFAVLCTPLFAATVAGNLANGIPISGSAITPTKGSLWIADGTQFLPVPIGSNTYVLTADSTQTLGVKWAVAGGGGIGTVTTVSVASTNGFSGTVANATSTPAITLTTNITGVLKGDGTAISAASSGTDYVVPAGSVATLTTPRSIYGNNFDGSAALAQIIGSAFGGTGNGFAKLSGPTTSEKTFTLPNSSSTILTDNSVVTVSQGGTGQGSYTNGQLLIGNTTGNTLAKATLTGTSNQIVVTNGNGTITLSTPQDIGTGSSPTFSTVTAALTGTATKTNALNSATTIVNVSSATAPTSGQVLTATSGTAATWQTPSGGNLTGPITSVGTTTSIASQTGTGTTFVMNASPSITTPTIGQIYEVGGFIHLDSGALSGVTTNSPGGFVVSGTSAGGTKGFLFTNGANDYNTVDTAIMRNSAGTIEINNGTPGTFRDIFCRYINPGTTLFGTAIASLGSGGIIFTDQISIRNNYIQCNDISTPSTPGSGGLFYSQNGHPSCIGTAGIEVPLASHSEDGPPEIYDNVGLDFIHKSISLYTGEIEWINTTRLAKKIDGEINLGKCRILETFDRYNKRTNARLIKLDWNAEQYKRAIDLQKRNAEAVRDKKEFHEVLPKKPVFIKE